MQWGTDGSLAWLTIAFIYKSSKSNVEVDALSRIDWEKGDETIQADSIQAIVTAAITRQGNDHIEVIPCSPQTIESLLPSVPVDASIVCKAITQSSGQSHLTYPETELFVSETESKSGNSSHLDPSLNPKCMTTSDWIEAQCKDKFVGDIIKMYRAKELQYQKCKETDNQEMRQFVKQRSKFLFQVHFLLYRTSWLNKDKLLCSTEHFISSEDNLKQLTLCGLLCSMSTCSEFRACLMETRGCCKPIMLGYVCLNPMP